MCIFLRFSQSWVSTPQWNLICTLTYGSIRSILTLCRLHSACANGFSVHLWAVCSPPCLRFYKCLFFAVRGILSIIPALTTSFKVALRSIAIFMMSPSDLLHVTGSLNKIILYCVIIVPPSFVTSRKGAICWFMNCRLYL